MTNHNQEKTNYMETARLVGSILYAFPQRAYIDRVSKIPGIFTKEKYAPPEMLSLNNCLSESMVNISPGSADYDEIQAEQKKTKDVLFMSAHTNYKNIYEEKPEIIYQGIKIAALTTIAEWREMLEKAIDDFIVTQNPKLDRESFRKGLLGRSRSENLDRLAEKIREMKEAGVVTNINSQSELYSALELKPSPISDPLETDPGYTVLKRVCAWQEEFGMAADFSVETNVLMVHAPDLFDDLMTWLKQTATMQFRESVDRASSKAVQVEPPEDFHMPHSKLVQEMYNPENRPGTGICLGAASQAHKRKTDQDNDFWMTVKTKDNEPLDYEMRMVSHWADTLYLEGKADQMGSNSQPVIITARMVASRMWTSLSEPPAWYVRQIDAILLKLRDVEAYRIKKYKGRTIKDSLEYGKEIAADVVGVRLNNSKYPELGYKMLRRPKSAELSGNLVSSLPIGAMKLPGVHGDPSNPILQMYILDKVSQINAENKAMEIPYSTLYDLYKVPTVDALMAEGKTEGAARGVITRRKAQARKVIDAFLQNLVDAGKISKFNEITGGRGRGKNNKKGTGSPTAVSIYPISKKSISNIKDVDGLI